MATSKQLITTDSLGIGFALFGSLFAAPGFFLFCWGFHIYGTEVTGKHGNVHTAGLEVIFFPLIFVVVGLGLAGIRSRKVIDPARRSVATTSGWYVWTKKREQAPFTEVSIGPMERRPAGRSRNGTQQYVNVIPVRVAVEDSQLEIADPREAHAAYALAIRVTLGSGVPLRNLFEPPDSPRPADPQQVPARVTVVDGPRGTAITLPWEGGLIMLIAACIIVPELLVMLLYFYDGITAAEMGPCIIAALLPSIIAVFWLRLFSGALGAPLLVTDTGLTYGHAIISSDDITVCTRIGKTGILVLTDRADIVIAGSQSEEIQHWLVAWLRHQLRLAPATDPLAPSPPLPLPGMRPHLPLHPAAHAPPGIPTTIQQNNRLP